MKHLIYYPVGESWYEGRALKNEDIASDLLKRAIEGEDLYGKFQELGPGWEHHTVFDEIKVLQQA